MTSMPRWLRPGKGQRPSPRNTELDVVVFTCLPFTIIDSYFKACAARTSLREAAKQLSDDVDVDEEEAVHLVLAEISVYSVRVPRCHARV